jgi:putative ATP-dependent endonuclease of OLD family
VITDGDPKTYESAIHYLGFVRGIALLSDSLTSEANSMLGKSQWHDVRRLLAEDDIYVGNKTLELDLLVESSDEIKQCYRDLRGSTVAANNFDNLVDSALAGDSEAEGRVMERIEDIGKGRFAQRLAAYLRSGEPPEYLKAAIMSIVGQVKGSWTT